MKLLIAFFSCVALIGICRVQNVMPLPLLFGEPPIICTTDDVKIVAKKQDNLLKDTYRIFYKPKGSFQYSQLPFFTQHTVLSMW